jgi:hypothetical protein
LKSIFNFNNNDKEITMFIKIIRIIILVLLIVVLIGGCSKKSGKGAPTSGELPLNDPTIPSTQNDLYRFLAYGNDHIIDNSPDDDCTMIFSIEGIGDVDGTYKTTLVDCVASTFYYDEISDTVYKYNYVLVCDTQGKWDDDWDGGDYDANGWIYKIETDIDGQTTAVKAATIPLIDSDKSDIRDPDACDLIAIGKFVDPAKAKLHAFVFDGMDAKIKHYTADIEYDDGDLTNGDLVQTITAHASNDHAAGMAVTPTTDDNHMHVIVCDNIDKCLYVYPIKYQNSTWQADGNSYTLAGISPDCPIDVCIVRYHYDAENAKWGAYVAVRETDSFGGTHDYLKCYGWNGSGYSNQTATSASAIDYFPGIIALDTQKVGCESDYYESSGDDYDGPEDQHHEGRIAVFMIDTSDLRGYKLRQVQFGHTANSYYTFTEKFICDIKGGIWAEGFAVCKYDSGSGESRDIGYAYVVSDRDPDLISGDGQTNWGENCGLFINEDS